MYFLKIKIKLLKLVGCHDIDLTSLGWLITPSNDIFWANATLNILAKEKKIFF